MGARVGFAIIMVLILGVALYAYNSGVLNHAAQPAAGVGDSGETTTAPTSTPLSNFFSSLFPHWPTSTGGVYGGFVPMAPSVLQPTQTSTFIGPAGGSTVVNPGDIPAGFTASQLSPYFHQIRFGSVYAGGIYSVGQITLNPTANQPAGSEGIDVTGWQIKSNRGGEFVPQAVNLYDPTGLTPATDIYLKNGDNLNIYGASAPINLRLNKCMGYLPNRNQFNPQIPQNCPYIDRSAIQSFSGACQNYILQLGGCRLPDFSDPAMPQNDYACRDYISNHFSYHSCYADHLSDTDFFSHEVRVWMGSSPIDQYHDRVLLLDQQGLLVDYYSY